MPMAEAGRISIFFPQGVQTGGPEALHQLCGELRQLGYDAVLVPIPGTESAPRCPDYDRYNVAFAPFVSDGEGDVIVFPEFWILPLKFPGKAQRVCWWLSVDFSPLFDAELVYRRRQILKPLTPAPFLLAKCAFEGIGRRRLAKSLRDARHIAQSHYAAAFVHDRLGVPVEIVSDYTTAPSRTEMKEVGRTPRIAFNPAKGAKLAAEVQAPLQDEVEWVPIRGMSREQVLEALRTSDIFLDTGHQPGKDRLPREAAASGAVVLLLEVGAGADALDFDIPAHHKISPTGRAPEDFVRAVRMVLADPSTHHLSQAALREAIAAERETFQQQVERFAESLRDAR
jgi:hypothetical protein